MSKNINITYQDIEEVIDDIIEKKEDLLVSPYRNQIKKDIQQVTTLDEEVSQLKKYFGHRLDPIVDNVFRLITYPDNYRFNFQRNRYALCESFLKKMKKKQSVQTNYYKKPKSEPAFGFQSFIDKYKVVDSSNKGISLKIPATSLSVYRNYFQQYLMDEVNKDRNRYSIKIMILLEEYPEKSPRVFLEDQKEILTFLQTKILEKKLKDLLSQHEGQFILYKVEEYVSQFLSELNTNNDKETFEENLSFYDNKIQYPPNISHHQPEEFIDSISTIISQLPAGVIVNNVETILRQDLIWRFLKFQALMKDKYQGRPHLYKTEHGFHGSPTDRMSGIIRQGLLIPTADNGLKHLSTGNRYGNGIYLSPDARFSMHYCRGDGCLLVCAVIPGRKYICSENLWDNDCVKGYDSHMSDDGTELVLFNEAQILPCIMIHFRTNEKYQDWWDVYYNGVQKKETCRQKMKNMNGKEKKAYLKSYAESYLPYGFGNGKFEVEDVSFPDDYSDDENAIWYGDIDNNNYNTFQDDRE